MVSFQSQTTSGKQKHKKKGTMPGADQPHRRRRQAEKKSEPGFRQRRVPTFLPPPPLPLPRQGPVANGLSFQTHRHGFACCPPSLSPPSLLSSNTVHHFGVAQLLSAASLCNSRSSSLGEENGGAAAQGTGPPPRYRPSPRTGTQVVNGVFAYPPSAPSRTQFPPESQQAQQHQLHYNSPQHLHYTSSSSNNHPHFAPQQVPNGYQTVSLSNLTGADHVGSESNNLSLNYIVNGNQVPVTFRQVPGSNNLRIAAEDFSHSRNSNASSTISFNNSGDHEQSQQETGDCHRLAQQQQQLQQIIPEISISALTNRNCSRSLNYGYLENKRNSGSSSREPDSASGGVLLGRNTTIRPYPCGPEVLQGISSQREITCKPLRSIFSPSLIGESKGFSRCPGERGNTVTVVALPEVTVSRTISTQGQEDNVDLSKLNYLSRLACEVEKLDTSVVTREQQVAEILTQSLQLQIPSSEESRESDSPVIIVTAINGKPVESTQQMGVFNTMANGSESSGGTVRIKQEAVDHHSLEESGDEVLDLRKPSSEKLCIWCDKNPTLVENGVESDFCSELCFHMFRRDSFKKRSNCIWCSGTSPVKNYSGAVGVIDENRFCSEECLTNYKVKLFCEETSAHLEQLKESQSSAASNPQGNGTLRGPLGNELITPELWLKKQSMKKRGNKNAVDHVHDPSGQNNHSSGSHSPVADSPQSLQSNNSARSSLSPTQQHLQPQTKQGQLVQHHPLKHRLYPEFTGNNMSSHHSRRRASSHILLDRERDRSRYSSQACNLSHRSPSTRSAPESQSYSSPRKRLKASSTAITLHGAHSGGNFLRNTSLSLDTSSHQQVGSAESTAMSISMMQMGAALVAMNNMHSSNPSLGKSSRKSHSHNSNSEINQNSEIARALMMGIGSRHHMNHHHTGPPPPFMMLQQGRGASASLVTHSGLHAGGLMVSSPSPKQTANFSTSSSIMSNNVQLSSVRLSPNTELIPAPVSVAGENGLEANGRESSKNVEMNGVDDQVPVSPTGLLTNGLDSSAPSLPMVTLSNFREEQIEQREIPMDSKLSSPVSTCSICTQTEPEEKSENVEGIVKGKLDQGGNSLSLLPPVTLLVPYPVPIPVPIPMPIFLPSHLNPNLSSKQNLLPLPPSDVNANEKKSESNEQADKPVPEKTYQLKPNEENCSEKESVSEECEDDTDKEIQAAIEMSLKECAIVGIVEDIPLEEVEDKKMEEEEGVQVLNRPLFDDVDDDDDMLEGELIIEENVYEMDENGEMLVDACIDGDNEVKEGRNVHENNDNSPVEEANDSEKPVTIAENIVLLENPYPSSKPQKSINPDTAVDSSIEIDNAQPKILERDDDGLQEKQSNQCLLYARQP